MYRPDEVMSWLAGLSGIAKEPWEFSHDWLICNGLHGLEREKARVVAMSEMLDRLRYFR